MDGTLIDTEPYWIAEETALVTEAGGRWTHEDGLRLVGRALLDSATIILESTPVTGSPEEVVDRLLTGVIARCQQRLPWQPGARQALQHAGQAGFPQALVTMSWTPLARVLIDSLPPGTFDVVVTGDRVTRGKPAPDPYLLAAAELNLPVDACLAIEDSPTGARSALAAGVPTVAVPHLVPVPPAPGMVTVDSLGSADADHLRAWHLEAATSARTAGGHSD